MVCTDFETSTIAASGMVRDGALDLEETSKEFTNTMENARSNMFHTLGNFGDLFDCTTQVIFLCTGLTWLRL